LVTELTTSAAHRERVFLEERLKIAKDELDSSARELSEFSSRNATLDPKEQGHSMMDSAATVYGQLIAAQAERSSLEQIYRPDNVRVRQIGARINELQRQLEKLGGPPTGSSDSSVDSQSLYPSIRKLPLLGVQYSDLYRRTKNNEAVFETLTKEY